MRFNIRNIPTRLLWAVGGVLVLAIIALTSSWWLPPLRGVVASTTNDADSKAQAEEHDDHAGHDHGDSDFVELSPQARRNIGLKTDVIKLQDFARSITVPAIVAVRPGQTTFQVAAPLTGVVTGVYVARGEAVSSGKLLFTLRLTHEDLVKVQTEFLSLLGQLDVEKKELARLEKIRPGVLAPKTVLERQYEVDKLEARLKAQREALQLHGLKKEQVAAIETDRELLRDVKVYAPYLHDDASMHNEAESDDRHPKKVVGQAAASPGELPADVNSRQFVIQTLDVHTGEAVTAGQSLCVLTDYSELYIEARAFEQDADQIVEAANQGRQVTAVPENGGGDREAISGLDIVYVSNEVERDSRALHFYVGLPNRVVRNSVNPQGRRFLTWKHKPGQRMQVRVPVETWENVIVLPVDAIAEEGPERYVFVENGGHFDRRPVHVKYRDQFDAVLANDGSVFPGDRVARTGAHQLQMALKNKAGGAIDPHAGHSH